jgi:hypothetical protein
MAPIPQMLERLEQSDVSDWAWHGLRRQNAHLRPAYDTERRRHVRVATDDPGLMKILEPFSPVRWLIRVVEVSKSGIGLVAQTGLVRGTLVQVYVKQTSILGVVRHTAPVDETAHPGYFRMGIEIQHVF